MTERFKIFLSKKSVLRSRSQQNCTPNVREHLVTAKPTPEMGTVTRKRSRKKKIIGQLNSELGML